MSISENVPSKNVTAMKNVSNAKLERKERVKMSTKDKKIGFLGLGTMGFSVTTGLVNCGFKMVLPTYRRAEDVQVGFSIACPTPEAKDKVYTELLEKTAEGSESQADLVRKSDIILLMMPNSHIIEMMMYGDDGIIANLTPGKVVIDLSSADASSTQKLAKAIEAAGCEMLDAPVSGGNEGATAQTLTMMIGGKKEVFEAHRDLFDTIGNPEKIMYIGPHGAGDIIKSCNNFLSCCCLIATTEAVTVAVKNGIDPHVATNVIASSGGRSDASMHKLPDIAFPGHDFNGTLGMMLKDMGLFTAAAKDKQVPTLLGNTTYQFWNMMHNRYGANGDMGEIVKEFERWCGVKLYGIDAK